MRKSVLIVSLLLFALMGYCQSNRVKNEILNYNDSNVEFITKGRRYLIDKLMDGDMAKVKEIKNALLLNENDKYLTFYPYEIRLILYLTGDYDELLYTVNSFDAIKADRMRLAIKPTQDNLMENLMATLHKKRTAIETNISAQVTNPENRDFLIMNLHYLMATKDNPDITREELNADADNFLSKHSGSKYVPYTRQYIRYKMVKSNWGYGFEMFSGYGLFTHNLRDKFADNIPFGVAFDVSYKNLTLYLRDYIGIGSTHQDIALDGVVWPNNTKANTIIPEASLGYRIPTKNRFQFAPFAGIGGLDFSPTDNQKTEGYYNKASDISAFAYIAGLNLDFRLGKTSGGVPLVSYNEEGYWFIRVRYAYVMPKFGNSYSAFEGNMHYLTVGVSVFGRKLKREY